MCIPDDAKVTSSAITNEAIGVESFYDDNQRLQQYSWGELRQRIADQHDSNVDWMDHVNEVIVGYIQKRNSGRDRVSFRTRENKVFRAVLSRAVQYKGGTQEFEMEVIESFPRMFPGDDRTSRLLIGLIFASRFRFMFIKRSADSHERKLNAASGPMFLAAARQLQRDIEHIEQEAAEFGLTRLELLIEDFGSSHEEVVRLFFTQWELAKGQLWAAITALIEGSGAERRTHGIRKF